MKIAIPVKSDKDNPAVAPLFGKAKWFALVEDGNITFAKNEAGGGQAVIEWFIEIGVDTIIFQEMGAGPYGVIKKHGGITVYHSGFERITINEVLEQFQANNFKALDDEAMEKIIKHHEGKHSHDHHGHGADHHHHAHH